MLNYLEERGGRRKVWRKADYGKGKYGGGVMQQLGLEPDFSVVSL